MEAFVRSPEDIVNEVTFLVVYLMGPVAVARDIPQLFHLSG